MSIDLRDLLGRFEGRVEAGITTAPPERDDVADGVEMLDDDSALITCKPLDVHAWVDGIQNSVCLGWDLSLPTCLHWVAAGGCDGARLLYVKEHMEIVGAESSRTAIERKLAGIDVEASYLPGSEPYAVMRNVAQRLTEKRDEMEQALLAEILAETDEYVVCDGSIANRVNSSRVLGVIKTTATRYLQDESVLWKLPKGHRSARFTIAAGRGGRYERHSCYVRLQPAERRGWDFGLVRLEAFDADLLEPLAARVLEVAQDGSRRDDRWDRHVTPVRNCEELLRSRRPGLF